MPTAHETLKHAIDLREQCSERLKEYEQSLEALSERNTHRATVSCSISVSQGTAWTVEVPASHDFVRPFVEAAVIKERDELLRMDLRLGAARRALQTEPLR